MIKDHLTEVRWFLSIQFSKSLVPWRAYQSRALLARCQALFNRLTGVLGCLPTTWGAQQYGSACRLSTPSARFFFSRRYLSANEPVGAPRNAAGPQLMWREKEGGRVPRQGRHVLDGTLDRMEGASLRGPETLPPWNLVFKWSDTRWYHSLGPGSFSTLLFDNGTSNAFTQSPI